MNPTDFVPKLERDTFDLALWFQSRNISFPMAVGTFAVMLRRIIQIKPEIRTPEMVEGCSLMISRAIQEAPEN